MKCYADIESNYTLFANANKDTEVTKAIILGWRDQLIEQYETTIEVDSVMALFNIPDLQRPRIEERAYKITEGTSYLNDTGRCSIIFHLVLTIDNPIEKPEEAPEKVDGEIVGVESDVDSTVEGEFVEADALDDPDEVQISNGEEE